MATTINTGELTRLRKILIDSKSEMDSYFNKAKMAIIGINVQISGSTNLDSTCQTFKNDIEDKSSKISDKIDECIDFLETQVTQYVQTTEQASSEMISFMSSLVSTLGLDGTVTIPSSIDSNDIIINTNTSIDSIQSGINDITNDITRLSNSLVTFEYISTQISQHWKGETDAESIIQNINKAVERIRTVIIPYLTKYTIVFTNLLESQKSISSSTVNSGVTFGGYAGRVAETK